MERQGDDERLTQAVLQHGKEEARKSTTYLREMGLELFGLDESADALVSQHFQQQGVLDAAVDDMH
jgi:hypothetical protein